jgi:hypothetical protein
MKNPIEIFFSYAHEDEALMDDVRRQLIVEERSGRILKWHDRKIPPGADWRQQIDSRLERAKIILLFMSPHFIESRYCYEVEGQAALSRHESGEARVVPVILRPCRWESSPFGKLQSLPRDAKPVSRWSDRDEACLDVANGVMAVVDELLVSRDIIQRFYWRTVHLDYMVNADAEVVYYFLLQNYTGIMHTAESENSTYFLDEIRAFNPKEHDTFQYGFIAGGHKMTARNKYVQIAGMKMTADPLFEKMPEMFFITISQGQKNTSIVSFDTDIRQLHAFTVGLERGLSKAFSVKLI